MKIYLVSAGAGVLVGVIYSLLNVRSPAPPLVALIGLLGMLVGEQVIPLGKAMWDGHAFAAAWRHVKSDAHIFGMLPGRHAQAATKPDSDEVRS
jgi:XapX domain-containing protein